ncbi:homeodomain-like protein [Tanacetum coccineum]
MESGNQGGGYPNFGKSRKHPLVPPPMTAIGRFLQGQSSQSHSSHHNFEINKEQFIPSNRVYAFSSSSNEGISGISYRNMHLNNEVIKSSTKIKSKGGCGKSLIKGQRTDEEDKKLLRLVKIHGERKPTGIWSNGFPGDMSPGITRAEKLEWDSFPGDLPGRQSRAHVVSVNGLSATVDAFPGRHVARESGVKKN